MFFKKKTAAIYDYVVVGLGNPGKKYENTRHNVGFMTADKLIDEHLASPVRTKFKAETFDARISSNRVLIVKPQTFMNNSGEAVRDIINFYKIDISKVILIFDDISLPVGKIRLRRNGSAGGHNGIKSIINLTGSQDYKRVKIGVGAKPHPDYDLADWVLGKFEKPDIKNLESALNNAVAATVTIMTDGIDAAMNKYSS